MNFEQKGMQVTDFLTLLTVAFAPLINALNQTFEISKSQVRLFLKLGVAETSEF